MFRENKTPVILFQGKDRWSLHHTAGEKEIRTADGPNGLRIELDDKPGFNDSIPANAFPTASCIACSFDEELLEEYGRLLGGECRSAGINVLLGPGVNHKRSPLCGRNFEYFSEDPLLSGKLAAAYIRGLQSENVSACLKHLAANNCEKARLTNDSVVDERTLHELYLRQFEIAVKEGKPWAVMPAYNLLNGVYCCENKQLLDEVRRWGFDGIFISDWGAVSSPEASYQAGLDVEMPGGNIGADELIKEAVQSELISHHSVYEHNDRFHTWTHHFDHSEPEEFSQKEHEDFIQRAAEESAVLLQNDGILPLNKEEDIAVIGAFAENMMNQGSGSSHVKALRRDDFLSVLRQEQIAYTYAPGYSLHTEKPDTVLEQEAVKAVKGKDAVLFFAGFLDHTESEGYDRRDLKLPDAQIKLLNKLAAVNPNIIVILQCGAPAEVKWRHQVRAVLCMYLAGMRSSKACLRLLYGEVDPCGHLAETWPEDLHQVPSDSYFDKEARQSQYREAVFSGYRWYASFDQKPAWSFGHGLSYTTFQYQNFTAVKKEDHLEISVDVTNAGERDGKALIQIYAALPSSRIARSASSLIGFLKVPLVSHETKHAVLSISLQQLAYWNTAMHQWDIEEGNYAISLNADALTPLISETVYIEGNDQPFSTLKMSFFHVVNGRLQVSDADYALMLRHEVPEPRSPVPFTPDTMLYELSACRLGKVINSIIHTALKGRMFNGTNEEMVMESPIRQALWMNKRVKWKTVRLMADYMNHHRFAILRDLICSMKK